MSVARVYSDQTLFDEPTRAVMNVTTKPAALIISKLIPADSGNKNIFEENVSLTFGNVSSLLS